MGQGYFHELGCHAQEGRHPHPKQRGRTAEENCQANTANITGADGTGKCRGEGLKVRSVTRITGLVVFATHNLDCVAEVPNLGKPKIQGKKEADP